MSSEKHPDHSPSMVKRHREGSFRWAEGTPKQGADPFQPAEAAIKDEQPCCDAPHIREENGFFVCLNCGMVHEAVLDASPRRAFTVEEVKTRRENEPVYSKIGPRTIIRGASDAKGSLLAPAEKTKFNRLAKIHRSLTTSYERNLWIALPNLQRFQEQLGLPDTVTEDALRIYTHAVRAKLSMGRSIDTLLAASIAAALRIHGLPRTLDEIVEISELNKKIVMRTFRLIFTDILPKLHLKVQHFEPVQYVDKFREDLGLSMAVRHVAVKLLEVAKKNRMPVEGKDPKGLAAAAVYLAGQKLGEKRTQSDIAQLARITEVTVRARVKELKFYQVRDQKVGNAPSSYR